LTDFYRHLLPSSRNVCLVHSLPSCFSLYCCIVGLLLGTYHRCWDPGVDGRGYVPAGCAGAAGYFRVDKRVTLACLHAGSVARRTGGWLVRRCWTGHGGRPATTRPCPYHHLLLKCWLGGRSCAKLQTRVRERLRAKALPGGGRRKTFGQTRRRQTSSTLPRRPSPNRQALITTNTLPRTRHAAGRNACRCATTTRAASAALRVWTPLHFTALFKRGILFCTFCQAVWTKLYASGDFRRRGGFELSCGLVNG